MRLGTFSTRIPNLRLFENLREIDDSRHNYNIMDNLHDILVIGALGSLALLWAFAGLGALASLSDTFGEHVQRLAERLKR